jgi:GNAT superfamily N-acetyltransferase
MLLELLEGAARGAPPPPDGRVEMLPAPAGPAQAAVVALTAHHVVASDAPEPWLRERLPEGDLLAPMSPGFLAALGDLLGLRCDGVDVVLAAEGLAGAAELSEAGRDSHPRVARARAHREEVRVFEGAGGAAVVVLGLGLAGRTEVAFEVDEAERGRGVATAVLHEARRLLEPGETLFAQTAPGNVASLRALLSAGFRPIGSEALFFDPEPPVRPR